MKTALKCMLVMFLALTLGGTAAAQVRLGCHHPEVMQAGMHGQPGLGPDNSTTHDPEMDQCGTSHPIEPTCDHGAFCLDQWGPAEQGVIAAPSVPDNSAPALVLAIEHPTSPSAQPRVRIPLPPSPDGSPPLFRMHCVLII